MGAIGEHVIGEGYLQEVKGPKLMPGLKEAEKWLFQGNILQPDKRNFLTALVT